MLGSAVRRGFKAFESGEVLVQIDRDQAMMTECNGLLESKHCSRDGISTDKSSPVGQLVHEFQIELQRFGHHDGGPRHYADAHHDSALGAAVFAGIREALEPLCSSGWRILENGRDLYKG